MHAMCERTTNAVSQPWRHVSVNKFRTAAFESAANPRPITTVGKKTTLMCPMSL